MNLRQWDIQVAPALRAIDEHSSWIGHYADKCHDRAAQLEHAVRRLQDRPEWETSARYELANAIQRLALCLALCRSAMEEYERRPVISEAAE
jgi:hypothetical protein